MDLMLRYPVFVIANQQGVLVAHESGNDCILLFHSKDVAELHIQQVAASGAEVPLYPLEIADADALRAGLASLPPDITCAIWDATATARKFVHTAIDELFDALDRHHRNATETS